MNIPQAGLPQQEPPERLVALRTPDTGFQSGFYLTFNDRILGDTNHAQVVVNGNLAVSWLGSTFEVDETGEPETLDVGIGLNGALTMELAVDTGGDLASSLRLAMTPLPSFEVGSITVSPYLRVRLRLRGTADAGARVSFVAPFHINTRSLEGESPDLSSDPSFPLEFGPPDATQAIRMEGRVELEVVVILLIAIEGIPVGGPVIGTSVGFIVEIDPSPSASYWWNVDSLAQVVGGWAFLPETLENLVEIWQAPRANLAHADGPLPVIGTESSRWSKVYDITGDDQALAAVAVDNGLVVLETGYHPWLASLDGLDEPRWQELVSVSMIPKAMALATNGDLVVVGSVDHAIRIDRYDPLGTPLWTRTLSVPDARDATCTAIVATVSNGIVIAGVVTHEDASEAPLFAAISDTGEAEWSNELHVGSGSTDAEIRGVALAPSGEILAVGLVYYSNATGEVEAAIERKNALIVRLRADGQEPAAYALGGLRDEEGMRIAMHGDGSYAIAGHFGVAPHVWIASMTDTDTLAWSAAYQSRPDVDPNLEYANPTGISTLEGNGLLVSGYTGSSDVDAWILRTDSSGMPVWVKTYRSTGSDEAIDRDELWGVVAVPRGLFAFGNIQVTEEDNHYSHIWVLRTSVDGMLHFTPDSRVTTESTVVQWERRSDHTLHALESSIVAIALEGDPVVTPPQFTVDEANVIGEAITE